MLIYLSYDDALLHFTCITSFYKQTLMLDTKSLARDKARICLISREFIMMYLPYDDVLLRITSYYLVLLRVTYKSRQ